jgi:uncharacterized protein (TIGR03663 family)
MPNQVEEHRAEDRPSSRPQQFSILDRRLDLTQVDPQVWIFIALLVVAALLRFWALGDRAMHHDEGLHAWFSWRFYTGEELYRYNPTFHGPFLYHITTLFYFLFGVSDVTARASQALFGVLLVALCYPLRRWLGRWGWLIVAGLLAFSPSFVYFSRFARHDAYVAVWNLALVIALFRYLKERRTRDLVLAAAVLALSFATKELTFITSFIFVSFLILAYALDSLKGRFRIEGRVVAAIVAGFAFLWELRLASAGSLPLLRAILMAVLLLALGFLGLSFLWPRLFPRGESSQVSGAVTSLIENPRPLFVALGVFGVIFGLLFTTLLTHPRGFLDGLVQGLEYWTREQETRRGGQPWFYYLLLLPLYEPIALTAGLAGFGAVLARARRAMAKKEAPEDNHGSSLFPVFVAYWAFCSLLLYSWAGEKMPWLLLHVTLPLVLLAGLALDRFLSWMSWRTLWESRDWIVGPMFLLLLFGVRGFAALYQSQVPHELANQYLGLQMGVLVLLFLVLLGLLAWRIYRIEGRHLGQTLSAVGLLLLILYTVRSTFLVNFYNGDIPVEMLVYTQTAPDVPLVVRQIERLGVEHTRDERTVEDPTGGHGLTVSMDVSRNAALEWPFNWYLRDLDRVGKLVTFSGEQGPPPDADILLVLADNEPTLHPYLVNDYTGIRVKHRWWFPEFDTYKRWTLWFRGPNELGYPTMPWLRPSTYSRDGVENLWEYLINRELPLPLGSQDFYLYVRNELLPAGGTAAAADPYLEELAQRPAAQVLAAGQLAFPRGIALDQSGNLFVADSGNQRIAVVDPQGQLSFWGSPCMLDTGSGCMDLDGEGPLPLGAGQFNEPWGVAVDPEGRVYVADTWNHRIQVFDQTGQFLGQWGEGRLVDAEIDTRGRAGTPFGFYGPRAVAVDLEGRVYVADTGNERIMAYTIGTDAEGNVTADFFQQWGTMGPEEGQFLEPVGVAVDASGRVYVVDTLNGRVQAFAPGTDGFVDPIPAATWEVTGWDSTSRENKPYIATGPGGQVYFTVPERHYAAVTDGGGDILAVWGGYGSNQSSFNLPIGVAVDEQGRVYVSDSGNGRVLVFTVP